MSRLFCTIAYGYVQKTPAITSVRLYGRWMHRQPAKVILPFEGNSKTKLKNERIIELNPLIQTKLNTKEQKETILLEESNSNESDGFNFIPQQEKSKLVRQKKEEKLKKRKFYLSQQKVFDDNNEIIYQKLKENDGRISSLLVKLKSKKDRQRVGQMFVEGWRLIVDGLEAKCNLRYVIFSQLEDVNNLHPFLPRTGVKFYKISYKEMKLWSDVDTSPGIIGVFDIPQPENFKRISRPLPLNIICDNIRMPGNLGAILRAAVGAGCEKVLLTKGCVDLWDSKVIRSAAGAHFRQPIFNSIDWEEMPKLLPEDTSMFIADSNARIPVDDDDTINKENQIMQPIGMDLPVLPYYGVDFSLLKHITLIIGGETEGISEESYRLAADRNGVCLNIPLQKGVDSLNTGMATAVIAFEIRKQIVKEWSKLKLQKQANQIT